MKYLEDVLELLDEVEKKFREDKTWSDGNFESDNITTRQKISHSFEVVKAAIRKYRLIPAQKLAQEIKEKHADYS